MNTVKAIQGRAAALALVASVGLWSGVALAQSSGAPIQAAAAEDKQGIEHVMKQQFDKPGAPLDVGPVSVEGDHAVAGWVQGARGGRALLKRAAAGWSIQVCGGDGLTKASTLVMTGMSAPAADALSRKVAASESGIPRARLRLLSLFKGQVQVGDAAHGHRHDPAASQAH